MCTQGRERCECGPAARERGDCCGPAPTGPDPGRERELAGGAARLLGDRSVRRPPGRTSPNGIAPARLVGARGECGTCALWPAKGARNIRNRHFLQHSSGCRRARARTRAANAPAASCCGIYPGWCTAGFCDAAGGPPGLHELLADARWPQPPAGAPSQSTSLRFIFTGTWIASR